MMDRTSLLKILAIILSVQMSCLQTIVGQLSVAKNFTDNMVLQRNEPIPIWGHGFPNTVIRIQFGSEIKSVTVKKDATWSVLLKKRRGNSNPQSISITNQREKIILKNILLGDVWLCIGQSNMEWPLAKELHFKEEVRNIMNPMLRFYNPSYAGKGIYNTVFSDSVIAGLNPLDFYKGTWKMSDTLTAPKMSAVGYYFGKNIQKEEKVPIGLINLAIGGAPLETFLRRGAFKESELFFSKARGNWLTNDELPVWIRERGNQNIGSITLAHKDRLGPNHAFKPGFAYESGIAPWTKVPIKGILWYQGESNAQELERVNEYASLQKLMVGDYRKQWKQPKLPFYWVQLSSIDTIRYKSHYWPRFRNEQRQLLNVIKYSGMAVSSDVGARNDVHPTNKKVIGYRLAQWALNQTYGKKNTPSGPLPRRVRYRNGKVSVDFHYAKKGLQTTGKEELKGFSLDGKHPVTAKITGNRVAIKSDVKPKFLYYAWQPYSLGNLENKEGLPASTFKVAID
ncbi:sialate O-acetylesterase [Maribacter chungangensis]|uniref:Sialate O-acetylesterase n=1 Tax=Maribacter chungangensis TaxID=1069117 RepID=A0ABW3B814_9FLAO